MESYPSSSRGIEQTVDPVSFLRDVQGHLDELDEPIRCMHAIVRTTNGIYVFAEDPDRGFEAQGGRIVR